MVSVLDNLKFDGLVKEHSCSVAQISWNWDVNYVILSECGPIHNFICQHAAIKKKNVPSHRSLTDGSLAHASSSEHVLLKPICNFFTLTSDLLAEAQHPLPYSWGQKLYIPSQKLPERRTIAKSVSSAKGCSF